MNLNRKNIVCFGGGTGLSSLLSGLKQSPFFNITAIVTMFDNGRSSGELRDRFGILPPGDIMKCMVALTRHPEVVREILNKRVSRTGRAPHSAGNMLLTGIEKIYGDYYEAIKVFGELLDISGQVIPVSTMPSSLCAELENGQIVDGQVSIGRALQGKSPITRIFLKPNVDGFAPAIEEIRKADLIIVGPGSFYDSVLSNFLADGISSAIQKTKVPIIFIMNLVTEGSAMSPKEPVSHWIKIAESYVGKRFNWIIINNHAPTRQVFTAYKKEGKSPLLHTKNNTDNRFVPADLWVDQSIARHDPTVLTAEITRLAIKLLG